MKDIKSIRNITYTDNENRIESIQPLEECGLQTVVGEITPIYSVEDHGRKKLTPVKFHKNGMVKSVSLQEPKKIKTSIGNLTAELLTFYPDGSLKRIFPLNGKISGYWTEENEYKLAETITVPSSVGELKVKPINIQFYKTGKLQSLTLWPQEKAEISTAYGKWTIKTGISFHEDGSLASCEPESPVSVITPIGEIEAYDPDPNGISGGTNSLSFTENGEVLSCCTIDKTVKAIDSLGYEYRFEPALVRSYCSDDVYMVQPLKIEFQREHTVFKNGFITCGKVAKTGRFSTEAFRPGKETALPMACSM